MSRARALSPRCGPESAASSSAGLAEADADADADADAEVEADGPAQAASSSVAVSVASVARRVRAWRFLGCGFMTSIIGRDRAGRKSAIGIRIGACRILRGGSRNRNK